VATTIPRGWRASDIQSLTGKKYLVTGATSGLGKETARELARAGAHVTITSRSESKGQSTVDEIGRDRLDFQLLDLMSLTSVRDFASRVRGDFDVLILNAGIMAVPYALTEDHFESQMATNHLGHFALAGLMKDRVKDRIVSVASQAHRTGRMGDGSLLDIKNLCTGVGKYNPWASYGASKLANIIFTNELQRRSMINNWGIEAMVAHPGVSETNLFTHTSMAQSGISSRLSAGATALISQSAARGALPTLCAATFPGLYGASYIGPDGFLEMRGFPKLTRAAAIAYNPTIGANLWQVSEELTGVRWA
jgi:NAD(P)-dependent dehydrogenase (short-subunit alcohol dehydrogenase family)